MKNQEKIFVIGHKNPDTDSICSAIAYCDIKNRTTQESRYIPKRAGQINEETEYVLNRFGVHPPGYLSNIGTQVKDMDIRLSPEANKSMSLKNAWDLMQENSIVSLPIREKDGTLEGLITIGDIAKTYMDTTDSYLLSRARTQYQRIAETIGGKVIEGNAHGYFIQGKIMVATANPDKMKEYVEENDMVIMGNREEDHLQAIEQNVSCIIVGMGIEVTEKVLKLAHEKDIVIISSPYDTFTISRLINQSIPVKYIMKTDNLVTFNTEDFTDDIQEVMIKHRHRAFPVINKKGKCIGTISRRNFLDMHRKKVVLVDHNEKDQAVDNIDKADIMEIIDHHKLGTLQTMQPISFRNQPVGCTGTIMYQMYGEQKLEIPPKIAGLLCAAIISDTLMFRSPTCTLQDKMAAGALALIADISIEQFAKEDTKILIDPVMGDNGEEYPIYTEALCEKMRFLVKRAAVITPNLTEALLLLYGAQRAHVLWKELSLMDEERLLKFTESTGKELSKEFDTEVVITGIDLPARENHQEIGNLICQDGNTTWVTAAKEGGSYSGTGDLFASVLSAGMVKGIDTVDSVHRAVKFLAKGIHDAVVEGTDRNEGICFERYLSELATEN